MKYDPFQAKAIEHIKNNESVIVSAPTGAGKTAIAEYVINDCLEKGTHAIYTAPIKALSNQKFRDFQGTFKDKIGILTGDVSINPDASILIMTTEIFRNKILEGHDEASKYSWIIYDEIHYIDDYERGTVWEESLIFLPKAMKMLALSATIPNIDEFASWLQAIHGKSIKVVKETTRPVPLHFFFQCQGEIVDNIHKLRRMGFGRDHFKSSRSFGGQRRHMKPNRMEPLVRHLFGNSRLPCIYFVFSRKRCEYLADEVSSFDFLDADERYEIKKLYEELCIKFGLLNEKSAIILQPLIERGIAYHHAGMLPTLKEVVERLFTSRLIKVIFTTETFALGINMPARTVIFDDLRKFYGQFHRTLRTRDFYQMAGRAGRRGIDTEGFVYLKVNPNFIQFEEIRNMIHGEYEKVRSRFNCSYATILNLYGRYGEKMYDVYPQSFHYFQEKKKQKEKALALMRAKVSILKNMDYIYEGKLSQKGVFAGKIYGYELPLTELYAKGILADLGAIEIGILAAALVFEPRKNTESPFLGRRAKYVKSLVDPVIRNIQAAEKKAGINPPSKDAFFHLSSALEAWMEKNDFDKILALTDTDEGELIRYFRMTIQILREILDTDAGDALKEKVKLALSLINRDIVDAEKQLRIEG